MREYIGRLFIAVALMFLPLVAPLSARAQTDDAAAIVISEIGWAGSSQNISDEWIELTNLSDAAVDVGGWTIEGAATSGGALAIPDGNVIEPFYSFLISNYANDDERSALDRAPDLVTTSLSLSNSSLALVLRDADGAMRDAAGDGSAPLAGRTAGGTGGGAVGDVGDGTASMVRSAPVADGTLAASWTAATSAAGIDAGAADLGTPGTIEEWFVPEGVEGVEGIEGIITEESGTTEEIVLEESVTEEVVVIEVAEPEPKVALTINYPVGTLIINEIVSDAGEEWIEIYNPYNNVIPLFGWTIRDASGKATALPEQLIGWDRYVVVRNPLGKLNNNGDEVELLDPNGVVIDAMAYGTADVPAAKDSDSLARNENGAWGVTTTPTPGAANVITKPIVVEKPKPAAKPAAKKSAAGKEKSSAPTKSVAEEPAEEPWSGPATLRLSELYPNTTGGDLVEEFVEIENTGATTVDLVGWSVSDASDRTHRFDSSLKIKPGELLTLTRADTRLALNNTTDSVTLIAPDGTVVDTQAYESPPKGSSLVRTDAGWVWTRTPTPDEQNIVSQDDPSGSEPARPTAAKVSATRVASASGSGRSVTTRVEGTVLVEPGILGKQFFYVETETGGLQIYKYDAAFPDLAPGDRVTAAGVMTENRGEPRLKVGSGDQIGLVASDDPPVPEDTTIAALTAADHGRLVRVSGTILSRSGSKALLENEGSKLAVRVAEGTDIDAALFAKGARMEVAGILVATDTGLTLLPRSPEDVTETLVETEPETAATTVSGRDAQAARDRTVSLAITAGVIAGLGLYSSRRLIRAGKHWYAKSRTLRVASQTTH